MLDVIVGVLPILGIVVLALLAVIVVLVLLALFFPVAYKFHGVRDLEKIQLTVKAGWLFGLVRVKYAYPEPGRLTARVLFFTLLNQKIPGEEEGEEDKNSPKEKEKKKKRDRTVSQETHTDRAVKEHGDTPAGRNQVPAEREDGPASWSGSEERDGTSHESEPEDRTERNQEDSSEGFFSKIEKIKYTIGSICDKIKGIWENISYYAALLQEEDTKQLFAQILFRIGKVLKNIRPRHIKAEILFGTGSPDTTGYVYGLYCMAVPFLGGARVEVTPDFEEAVLRGELEISGHVTLWVLVINVLRLFFDKNLRSFLGRMKAGKKEASRQGLQNGGKNGREWQ